MIKNKDNFRGIDNIRNIMEVKYIVERYRDKC